MAAALRATLLLALAPVAWAAGPADAQRAAVEAQAEAPAAAPLDGSVETYVAAAVAAHPRVAAARAHWRADALAIRGAAALPEPTVSVGVFVQPIETRTGPQQARVGLQQRLPWPGVLLGPRDAATARAEAAEAHLQATALTVAGEVRRRYWALWGLRATRQTHREHLQVLDDLAETLRARVEVGAASLADLQQVDLSRARLEDAIRSMDAREAEAEAALGAALGGVEADGWPTTDAPEDPMVPAWSLTQLREAAAQHPDLDAASAQERAAAGELRAARAQRLPGLTVGADWTAIGQTTTHDGQPGGQDALSVGGGVQLPLWQRAYGERVRSAEARQTARAAEADALAVGARAAVTADAARVADHARQVAVVRDTLLPMAEGTYASLLGSTAVGQATVAQVLLAQRDLLALQVQLEEAQAALQQAWADLEQRCGVPIPRTAPEPPR